MNPPYNTIGMNPKTGNLAPVELPKLRDETRASTTAFADDDTMVTTIGAGERLVFQTVLHWRGNNPGSGKLTFATPAAPVAGGYVLLDGGAAPIQFGLATGFNGGGGFYVLTPLVSANDIDTVLIWGNFINGVNAGSFSFQWAQNANNVVPTTLLAGSQMNVWRLSP